MRTQPYHCFLGGGLRRLFVFRAHSFSFFHFFSSALFFFRQIPSALFFSAIVRAFFSLVSVPPTPVCLLSSCVRAGVWGVRWAAFVCGGRMVQICGDVQRQEQSRAPPLGSRSISTKLLRVGVRACACAFQVRFDGEREEQGLAPVLDLGWAEGREGGTEGRCSTRCSRETSVRGVSTADRRSGALIHTQGRHEHLI